MAGHVAVILKPAEWDFRERRSLNIAMHMTDVLSKKRMSRRTRAVTAQYINICQVKGRRSCPFGEDEERME